MPEQDKSQKTAKGILLIAHKREMTQVFAEEGEVVPVTVLSVRDWPKDLLQVGDLVDVRGRSKGKGFMGVVKRYSFAGAPKTHGTKHTLRKPGSIGSGTDPGKVWKGQKMAGRHAHRRVTVRNLAVIKVDPEQGEICLKGAVPGARGSKVDLKIKPVRRNS